VNSVADPGAGGCTPEECTLREAITAANAVPFGDHEISFAPKLPTVITLAAPGNGGGELVIEEDLAISGPSVGMTIQRNSADPEFRIFRIEEAIGGTDVRFANLIIQRGHVSSHGGGGIWNHQGLNYQGNLTLVNTTVRENSGMGGGGILNWGDLVVSHSTITRNAATDANSLSGGGGIQNALSAATALISHSTISGNTVASSANHDEGGAGIWNVGLLTIESSTISGNVSDGHGGGVFLNADLSAGGIATITNSTISGNSAGVSGGGIYIFGDNVGAGRFRLINSTMAGNSAGTEGGGFKYAAAVTLDILNSIFALNAAPTAPDFAAGPPPGGTHFTRFNLLGIGNGSEINNGVDGNQVGTNTAPLDPRLGALANNGGPTKTHALRPGSPALDAASTADCPSTDQRGVVRPQGSVCDIGSYERQVKGAK
jgi:CSLREA domain-containing protein